MLTDPLLNLQTPYGVIHSVIPRTEMSLGVPFIMFAQYTGITASLSICGAVFVNGGLKDLMELLPGYSSAQLNSILSGQNSPLSKNLSVSNSC